MSRKYTPGPWGEISVSPWEVYNPKSSVNAYVGIGPRHYRHVAVVVWGGHPSDPEFDANARLIAAAPDQNAALNYVADMTCIGVDGEWHFKPGYDPQVVLDAIAKAEPQP